jgi:hypothetical protein
MPNSSTFKGNKSKVIKNARRYIATLKMATWKDTDFCWLTQDRRFVKYMPCKISKEVPVVLGGIMSIAADPDPFPYFMFN